MNNKSITNQYYSVYMNYFLKKHFVCLIMLVMIFLFVNCEKKKCATNPKSTPTVYINSPREQELDPISQNIDLPCSDEEVEEYLSEKYRDNSKDIEELAKNNPNQPDLLNQAKFITTIYIIDGLLKMNRPDIAIREVEKYCSEKQSSQGALYMILGFLYLDVNRFNDAIIMFEKSLHCENGPFFEEMIANGCFYGCLMANIGMEKWEIASTQFLVYKQLSINKDSTSELKTLEFIFACPFGLYKLITTSKPKSNIEYTEDKDLIFRIYSEGHFEINIDFAKKRKIDVEHYPKTIKIHVSIGVSPSVWTEKGLV